VQQERSRDHKIILTLSPSQTLSQHLCGNHGTLGSGISIQFVDEVAALEILDRSDAAKIAVAKS